MAGRSPTILITDDAKVYRLLVKQCLKGRGYHCLIPAPAWRGGDFFDFVPLTHNKTAVVIADVI